MKHLEHLQNELSAYLVDSYMFGKVEITKSLTVMGLPEASRLPGMQDLAQKSGGCLYFLVERNGDGSNQITAIDYDNYESMRDAASKIRAAVKSIDESKEEIVSKQFTERLVVNAGQDYSPAKMVELRRANPDALIVCASESIH